MDSRHHQILACLNADRLYDFFSGMAEIRARNALFTCSEDLKTFAISGSIITIKGSFFMRAAKRFGFALL